MHNRYQRAAEHLLDAVHSVSCAANLVVSDDDTRRITEVTAAIARLAAYYHQEAKVFDQEQSQQ